MLSGWPALFSAKDVELKDWTCQTSPFGIPLRPHLDPGAAEVVLVRPRNVDLAHVPLLVRQVVAPVAGRYGPRARGRRRRRCRHPRGLLGADPIHASLDPVGAGGRHLHELHRQPSGRHTAQA